jgi:hypothetical protein
MLLTQATAKAMFAALFERAGLETRLRHFASLPKPIVLTAIALADNFAITVRRFTGFFVRH